MTNQKRNWTKILSRVLLFGIPLGLILFLGTIQALHSTSDPSFCAKCHDRKGVGIGAEVDSWENSAHGQAGVSCLDCHAKTGFFEYMRSKMRGAKDAVYSFFITEEEFLEGLEKRRKGLVSERVCLHCHSDSSTVEGSDAFGGQLTARLADEVQNPEFRRKHGLPDIMTDNFVGGTHFDHARHMKDFDFTCATCHFGVVHEPRSKRQTKEFCLSCHEVFPDTAPQLAECTVCHEAQLAINQGTGAKGLEGDPGFMHEAEIGCVDCHTDTMDGFYRPPQDICLNCHDDAYMDILESWQEDTRAALAEAEELRAEAEKLLYEAEAEGKAVKMPWHLYQRALYNLNLVENDATEGVHNFHYVNDVILASVKEEFQQLIKKLHEL